MHASVRQLGHVHIATSQVSGLHYPFSDGSLQAVRAGQAGEVCETDFERIASGCGWAAWNVLAYYQVQT